jgi:release factor glutamine methyltransferase
MPSEAARGLDVGGALAWAAEALAHLESPRSEALALVATLLGLPRPQMIAFPERKLTALQIDALQDWLARRSAGEPLAYLSGRRGFRELELLVQPGVLVPRPETELLVELALDRLPPPGAGPLSVADLGTGSGAIALSLARARPDTHCLATDTSPVALATARANAEAHDIRNVEFLQSDWWAQLPRQRFQLIASNPPYLAAREPELLGDGLCQEPREALVGGEDGLRSLVCIIAGAPGYLARGGWLVLEHGHRQASAVQALMRAAGFGLINTRADLAGLPRVTLGSWSHGA